MKLLNSIMLTLALLCSSAFACTFHHETDYVSKECGAYQRDFKQYFDEHRRDYPTCGVFVHYSNTFSDLVHYAKVKVVVRCDRYEHELPQNINGFERNTYIDTQVLRVLKPDVFVDLMKSGVFTYVREYTYEEVLRLSEFE